MRRLGVIYNPNTAINGNPPQPQQPQYIQSEDILVNGNQLVLSATSVTAGSYGSASTVATFTVNVKGRITAASSTTINITDAQITYATRAANLVWAGPTTGAAATPTFRSLVAADIPNLPASIITSGIFGLARGGTGADLSATGGANQVVKQSTAGGAFSVGALVAGDIPSLDAAKITTGTIATARLGSGTANSTTVLFGDQTYKAVASIATPPTWSSSVTYALNNLVVGSDGNWYRALGASTNSDPTADAWTNWELYLVTANTTLTVTGRFSLPTTAYNFVKSAVIRPGVLVTISLGAATYAVGGSTWTISSPYANQIKVVGAGVGSTTITFTGANGITVESTQAGTPTNPFLQSLKIQGDRTVGGYGIYVRGGASLYGSTVTIDAFERLVNAAGYCSVTTLVGTNPGAIGVLAAGGGWAEVTSCNITGRTGTGDLLRADGGGLISATSGTLNGNALATSRGLTAVGTGRIYAPSCSISNCVTGATVNAGGIIYRSGATTSGNTTNYSPALQTVTTTAGSAELSIIY